MTTIAFWAVALLTATKTTRDIRTPKPFEWVGELAAGILAMLIAFLAAYALSIVTGITEPTHSLQFQADIAPRAISWTQT